MISVSTKVLKGVKSGFCMFASEEEIKQWGFPPYCAQGREFRPIRFGRGITWLTQTVCSIKAVLWRTWTGNC